MFLQFAKKQLLILTVKLQITLKNSVFLKLHSFKTDASQGNSDV